MADTITAVSPLRRCMTDDMMLRNLSPATQRTFFLVHRLPARNRRLSMPCGRNADLALPQYREGSDAQPLLVEQLRSNARSSQAARQPGAARHPLGA